MAAKKGAAGMQRSGAAAEGQTNTSTATDEERALARKKRLRACYRKFKALEERQKVVERARGMVYDCLLEMTDEYIELAKQGNCSAAKFLTKFAGIEEIPMLTEAMSQAGKAAPAAGGDQKAAAVSGEDPTKAVLSFYKKLEMTPPRLKPPKPAEAVEAQAEIEPAVARRTAEVRTDRTDD